MAYYDNAPSHKPQGKKSFGREKWVEEGSEYRGARHGGRPSGKRDDNRAYGEKKSFGDRKPYGEKKSFGDRKPYGEKKSFGDRKPYGEKKSFGDRKPYGEKKSYDDRKSYGEKKSYDDRKPYERRDRYDRRPEMADERPASSYRDSEYRPVAVAPVMAQPVAEEAVQENLLAGRNPIREALKAGRDIEKLLVQKGELTGSAREIVQMAKEAHIPVQEVEHQRLNELAKNHQGMVAFASAYQYSTVEAMLAEAEEKGEDPFLILLDGITDPHNLGAIIRSAECVGAHGVIVPERRAVGLTPAAVKASAGAIEHIKVARVVNMTRVIEMLKARNIWTYALTMDGTDYEKVNFKGGVALVVGSEGEGISHLVLENCDQKVSLPMAGHLDSLNASVAAGVVMYRVLSSRRA
jgi:23S rRNA (guanosine2251-2'-O)-methyltransferase